MLNYPKITIVTPSYNQGQYLEETIHSVLSQNYPHLEYIVVDGGSTDNSPDIIRKYQPHLAWSVSEKDRGQSHALNKGFARATGQVYGYINSDDLLEPNSLHTVGELFANGAQWIASSVRCFQKNQNDFIYEARPNCPIAEWLSSYTLPQPGIYWSADLHKNAGQFREDLHYVFDAEYWIRMRLKFNIEPTFINKILAAFRMHEASKTVSQDAKFELEHQKVRREYRRILAPHLRIAAWASERKWWAAQHQVRALAHASSGQRRQALMEIQSSLLAWPPLSIQRSTLGALRRAITCREK